LAQQKKGTSSTKAGANTPIKTSRIDAEGIAKGVAGGSTANKTGGAGGTALSREEQDLLDAYFALLIQHLRDAHENEKPTGLSDQLFARAEFYLAADGSISRARIIQSSGNAEFDKSVLAALRNVRTIGRRPDGKGDVHTVRFQMKESE
jgi:TonB family protein